MNPESHRQGQRRQGNKATEIVAREAATFIAREAGTESLITVVRAVSTTHGERINIFVSVYPIEKARAAMGFLERQREAFSDYLKSHARIRIPRVEFLLDNGEDSGGPGGIGHE